MYLTMNYANAWHFSPLNNITAWSAIVRIRCLESTNTHKCMAPLRYFDSCRISYRIISRGNISIIRFGAFHKVSENAANRTKTLPQ